MTTTTLPTGAWTIDPTAAHVGFSGRVSRLAPAMRARFTGVAGSLRIGGCPSDSQVTVTVDARSMTTGNRAWDEMLASVDPFDVHAHPVATYVSTDIRWHGTAASVDGVLTLRGIAQPVNLAVTIRPDAGRRAAFRATGTVDREQFGVRCEIPGLGRLIPRQLRLEIDVATTPASGPDL